MIMAEKTKKAGRPKSVPVEDTELNEKETERLDMADKKQEKVTIEDVSNQWKSFYNKLNYASKLPEVGPVIQKWNTLNPFLQNQRIKNIYSHAQKYGKANIIEFLENPGNNEQQLRSLAWANSASQTIYYNIIRRSADIPKYNYFKIPDLFDKTSKYKEEDFKFEDKLTDEWLELFNIPNTFKTIALEVKREGKSSYVLRNKIKGEKKSRVPAFCTLQKLPTDWVKITGKGQLGFTVSFNFMYFMNIANSPANFGEYFAKAWEDLVNKKVVNVADKTVNMENLKDYKFTYENQTYDISVESITRGKKYQEYFLWLKLPYDICYTFGSDNSNPWVAPDTMGLMLKLQELTDYGTLAGLIASTPLTSVLTGEIEPIANPRAGKNESIFDPGVLDGMMQRFNDVTSTNTEAWFFPVKNIKLQQLSSDVNSSDIITTATENFIESAGEGGLTITTAKPNVAQVNVAKQLAASQQEYVTLQMENVMNFILQHKLGLEYRCKIRIWDDIFNHFDNVKFLKEVVSSGNIAMLPKLMSGERISMRDTKAIAEYIKTLDFYKEFMSYTQASKHEMDLKSQEEKELDEEENEEKQRGRPEIPEGNIENDATAASRDRGDNTSDNRE